MSYKDIKAKTSKWLEQNDQPTEEQVARAQKIGLTPKAVQAFDRSPQGKAMQERAAMMKSISENLGGEAVVLEFADPDTGEVTNRYNLTNEQETAEFKHEGNVYKLPVKQEIPDDAA